MPKYKYRCADCDIEFVAHHSVKDKIRDCSYCGVIDSLIRVPGTFVSSIDKKQKGDVGTLTREAIEEFKQYLKSQKTEAAGGTYG